MCGHCGKAEGVHWKRHWKRADHPKDRRELVPGEEPTMPWRADWVKELPLELMEIFDLSIMVLPPPTERTS